MNLKVCFSYFLESWATLHINWLILDSNKKILFIWGPFAGVSVHSSRQVYKIVLSMDAPKNVSVHSPLINKPFKFAQ